MRADRVVISSLSVVSTSGSTARQPRVAGSPLSGARSRTSIRPGPKPREGGVGEADVGEGAGAAEGAGARERAAAIAKLRIFR